MTEKQDRPDNSISPEVAAANARLEAIRAQRGITPRPADPAIPSTGARLDPTDAVKWQIRNAIEYQDRRRAELDRSRYGAEWVAARRTRKEAAQNGPGAAQRVGDGKLYGDAPQNGPQGQGQGAGLRSEGVPACTVRIAPALAAHCLDYDHGRLDAPYQLYEILRALDQAGRGDLSYAFARETLCDRESPYYRYGRRRLIEVLKRGADIFWHVAKDDRGTLRIWLHKRARVAALFKIRLAGNEAEMPLSALIPEAEKPDRNGRKSNTRSRHAEANAALYAAFHAGREKPATADPMVQAVELATAGKVPTSPAGPIARGKLRKAAGISRFRQRSYERRARIRVMPNLRLSPAQGADQLDRKPGKSWGPVFPFIDRKGFHGPAGAAYDARRLPNSYHAPNRFRAVFTQRTQKINREADRLRKMWIDAGSIAPDSTAGPQPYRKFDRVFFEDHKTAERAYLKGGRYVCWKMPQRQRSRFGFYNSIGMPQFE